MYRITKTRLTIVTRAPFLKEAKDVDNAGQNNDKSASKRRSPIINYIISYVCVYSFLRFVDHR